MKTVDMPLVSVITVCFNLFENGRDAFFRKCVESVRCQDYAFIEHIVIDGASRDATVALLDSYAAEGWIQYVSEPDSGIYDAMNKGIRRAQGKYIAFLNSDDFWHRRDAVSSSVQALEKIQAAFSYAPRTIIQENGAFYCNESASLGVFPALMPFCHQTMFTRRDLLLQYGCFDAEHYRSAADYDLIFRMLLGGCRGVYVARNFTTFRLGGYSVEGAALSLQECRKIRCRLLGKRASAMLEQGQMDENLLLRLMERVHPRVALDIQRCFSLNNSGRYVMHTGLLRHYGKQEEFVVMPSSTRESYSYYLFRFFPLVRCKKRAGRTDWLLFNVLPLLRIRCSGRRQHYYLFFILPVLSCR